MTEKKKIVNKVKGRPKIDPPKTTLIIATIVTQFLIIIILVIALTTMPKCANDSLAGSIKQALNTTNKTSTTKRFGAIMDSDHVMGKRDSKATVIMYVDMQCPACAQMMPIYRSVYEKYKDKATFAVRYFIIESHVYARTASLAVEAAAEQGYYWEMMNAEFEMRSNWAYVSDENMLIERLTDVFEKATSGKGDKDRFLSDMKSESVAKKVDGDHQTGRKDNITATPTIIINNEDIDFSESELDVDDLMAQKINKALE